MKKVINGKMYNTGTAQLVAQWENMANVSDFSRYCENLYLKKTGEFFIHGEGGPATKYAKSIDNNTWTSGERIIPLPYEAAQKWAERCLSGDKYEEIFGPVAEDESMTSVTLRLRADTAAGLRRTASARGVGVSELVEMILRDAQSEAQGVDHGAPPFDVASERAGEEQVKLEDL